MTIQFGSNLRADVEVQVNPDRPLEDREDMEFDDEGNLIVIEKQEETPETEVESTTTESAKEETADAS